MVAANTHLLLLYCHYYRFENVESLLPTVIENKAQLNVLITMFTGCNEDLKTLQVSLLAHLKIFW